MSSASRRSTTPAPSCCSGSSPPPTNGVPWASDPTGPSTSGAGSCPSTPPPSACSTGSCTTRSSWSPKESHSGCARHGPRQEDASPRSENHRGMETFTWPPAATRTWPLTPGECKAEPRAGSGRGRLGRGEGRGHLPRRLGATTAENHRDPGSPPRWLEVRHTTTTCLSGSRLFGPRVFARRLAHMPNRVRSHSA